MLFKGMKHTQRRKLFFQADTNFSYPRTVWNSSGRALNVYRCDIHKISATIHWTCFPVAARSNKDCTGRVAPESQCKIGREYNSWISTITHTFKSDYQWAGKRCLIAAAEWWPSGLAVVCQWTLTQRTGGGRSTDRVRKFCGRALPSDEFQIKFI